MLQIRQLCITSLLLVSGVASAANVRLQVEGLSGGLEKNVRAQLSTIQSDEVTPDRRFRARVDDAIREGLKALGYYEPTIDFDLRPPPAKGRQVLIAKVTPGEPVRIGGTEVILRGGARTDRDYLDLLNTRPAIGTILNHGDYDSFKSSLTRVALRKGYFDSEFNKSQLGVSLDRHQAFWDIDYNSGERYRFGPVTFEGSQIRDEYLQNLVPFKQGDYYTSQDLAELNRRLAATGWFSSVVVAPQFEKSRQTKVLPLQGVVSPRKENTVETGVGYSTDVGPRVKGTWRKPWMNSYGHSLTSSLSLSAPEQQLDFSYKVPLLKSPLEQYYLMQGGFKRTDLNDTQADSTTLAVSRYWEMSSGWQRALNLRWSLDHFTQANVTNTTMLIYPGVSVNRTRSRGGLMPTWGDSQRYSVDYSNTMWGSDINFIVMQAQDVWIRTLYDRHRFVVRGNLGWIEADNFSKVPPDLRFFAGGDRSIRGYKYKSISPKDDDGKLMGASKLATGSLEYQYNVSGKWWGAVFVDSGEAVSDIRESNFKTGAGLGVRWQSPVGPIKLDIARPIGDKEEHGLQFYIGLGPEL
ncbi:autotransporter assembly complex protein TamA [Klebsiella oxytoca]|uniref:autotransporter assembly complex protein TamA n=1 Tax=Klebsiella oxytoca TaxID=571 RepID=UPI0013D0D939|nr:autotransporter assembly complex protein TamA [Klebsiella oxytoca]MDU2230560.1 autotransporter assembly complex protein TamA [Clostridium perfringens]EKW2358990.1 autotransporter assembly complex protein TamA [Klebsiella oxytoca]EKW2419001.1 autotransporter assembly complex protein TamA [Klebsiella oxytoca]ELK0737007.1 autotransporter assembly complex protein TamA [Klebsiella oxytoca]ELX8406112.1 autotransporter assembly complex protein TamA [Klebsiella oxytoca]